MSPNSLGDIESFVWSKSWIAYFCITFSIKWEKALDFKNLCLRYFANFNVFVRSSFPSVAICLLEHSNDAINIYEGDVVCKIFNTC